MQTYWKNKTYHELVTMAVPDATMRKTFLRWFPNERSFQQADWQKITDFIAYGATSAQSLIAAMLLGQRSLTTPIALNGNINSSYEFSHQLMEEWLGQTQEQLVAYALNVRNQILDQQVIFRGGNSECPIYMDQLFAFLLRTNAHGVIVAHNHPSGDEQPSAADQKFYEQLKAACQLMHIKLVDNLILGQVDYYSWREQEVIQTTLQAVED
ncbi:JAB domain-containing protein [Limosilactobacillus equigenerosi]|uniref:DNA repair protein RadC n=1 Tax=Limosilactobacillus equigenerosi DSM 18793 = JCM 14505 TaxID=1423742 RepID=A0A0R1UTE7_9LACO|nr:JAB domain-containing protein [Limosilactobacillus equigenerosi]KRL96428.1 DNA repair protein RadC [Limosilactobacillus equigenerosi DSM 18793 = JCM 14505]